MIGIKAKLKLFMCIIFFSFSSSAFAQEYPFDFSDDNFVIDYLWDKVSTASKERRPKIAIVLGGGGARGFAHIGVLKVLAYDKFPIDLVVGTSVGSIAGAFYCAGVPMDKVENLAKTIKWTTISNFSITSMLGMALADKMLSNKKLESFVNDNLGNITFDKLQTPLVIVATDLNTGQRVLLTEGSVGFAARASSTIPGFFEPVSYRQRFLVDGGLSENIPVNVAKLFNPDIIIAVVVSADITKNNADSVLQVLLQAIYIQGASFDAENIALADALILPQVSDISVSDFVKAPQAIEQGEIGARQALRNLKMTALNKTNPRYLFD
ncbi:MAG: patatin-like phospholipase family protein [Elusimicrobiota bacterium]|nr:patatin-like phospholipase family protein [Elusimicrobiota bacterium]